MRWKSCILSFLLTLAIGVAVSSREAITDWLWPSFSRTEVERLVGQRVRYRQATKFVGMKCPDRGICKQIADGERGTIVGLERIHNCNYFLIVRWDESHASGSYLSYFGRYTRRESLTE